MEYQREDVLQYVREEDVRFIRMAFADPFGRLHNVAVMSDGLLKAFAEGVAIDASAIPGFPASETSDLLLLPEPDTFVELPWRPHSGRVGHMFCRICRPDGTPYEADSRRILAEAVKRARAQGLDFSFGTEIEFYLFRLDENGERTDVPFDRAGYMDVAPEDRGENVRREICLTLEQMGMHPERSHHESGPGQNEVDFRHAEPLAAADHAILFQSVVKNLAAANGLAAVFSPKPLPEEAGSGLHLNVSAVREGTPVPPEELIPGVLAHAREMTAVLNPVPESYARLGRDKAPGHISWSKENRSRLIRVPAASPDHPRFELRSPDPSANPYLAFALVIEACVEGLGTSCPSEGEDLGRLPKTLFEARAEARESRLLMRTLPEEVLALYTR